MLSGKQSFRLEDPYPGVFMLQGLSGGAIAGYLAVVEFAFHYSPTVGLLEIFVCALAVAVFAAFGFCKSVVLWFMSERLNISVPFGKRLIIGSLPLSALTLFLSLREADVYLLLRGLFLAILTALPTAILVGSDIRPWRLFSFGSLAVGNGRRATSNSVIATIGCLPLRLISIVSLALCLLYSASEVSRVSPDPVNTAIAFMVFVYLLFNTYISVRSPRRIVVLIVGELLSAAFAAVAYLSYVLFAFGFGYDFLKGALVLWTFVILWLIFLVARLAAPITIEKSPSLSIRPALEQTEHPCLGSRFWEWQATAKHI